MLTLDQRRQAAPRRQVPLICNPARLTPADRRVQAQRLDRLTARFAYIVMALTALMFIGQGVRYLIQSGALS